MILIRVNPTVTAMMVTVMVTVMVTAIAMVQVVMAIMRKMTNHNFLTSTILILQDE